MMYRLARFVCFIAIKGFFRPKITGINNIPKSGGFIIASNHISMFDPVVLITTTKRRIHFLAKSEIFKFPLNIIFGNLELIKVNRNSMDKDALDESINYLKNNHVIGIFPEGTRERGRGILDFKYGAVKMAKETNTPIIPVGIKGNYNWFSNKLHFNIGKPIYIKKDLNSENEKLKDKVRSLIDC